MKEQTDFKGLIHGGLLFVYCFGVSVAPPSWGQASMPPTQPAPEATAPLPDPFYLALEGLSKKYGVAFVAEGRPLLSSKTGPLLLQNGDAAPEEAATDPDPTAQQDLSQEEAVQKVAARFDYDAVRHGSVYLLQKLYTNPDDLPEVTPEELRGGLKSLGAPIRFDRTFAKAFASSVNANLLDITKSRHPVTQAEFVYRVLHNGKILHALVDSPASMPDMFMYWLARDFFFLSHDDRARATRDLLANSLPRDPVFHWQPFGQTPVFGYDTQFNPQANRLFIPAGDCDRIVVTPYGTPLPRADYWMRTGTRLPDPDPTDPKTLSAEMKRFLDDNGKSSRAVTIAEALSALNKRVPKGIGSKIYQPDPIYASKRVTMVGTEKLSPETLIQCLAAVYGLGVEHRRDDHVVLTGLPGPTLEDEAAKTYFRGYDKYAQKALPPPLYRVLHARFLAGRTKTKNQEGPRLLEYDTQYEFQRLAATLRNTAMRQFRYLAEPQVKAADKEKLPLSHLGEREQKLFMFAQTIAAYAGHCELAEIPLPPYVTHSNVFQHPGVVKITGGVYQKGGSPTGPYVYDPLYFSRMTSGGSGYSCPDDTARLALFMTYTDPNSGVSYGPVQFLDTSLYLPDLE